MISIFKFTMYAYTVGKKCHMQSAVFPAEYFFRRISAEKKFG